MEDYIIAPDLLKEMQQDGLIDQINEDIEPKPQPLPNNTILSVTKKMINKQINNKNNLINNQNSLIPEVSESQENAESISLNFNSSSITHIKNRNDFKIMKQNSNYNEKNYDLIKEERNEEEDNNEEQINNKENYENDDYNQTNENYSVEKELNQIKKDQSDDLITYRSDKAKTDLNNNSLTNEEIEPSYNNINTNTNFTNYSLTPERHSKFGKNKPDMFINKKNEMKEIKKLQNELNMLTKQFNKIDKSLKHRNEELKKIKALNDDLLRENNDQKKIIDSIKNENVMLNSKIISLKDYCNKIETKLVSGSKNQHIIEINNKLRQENESLINQIKYYDSEKNDLIKNNELLNDELTMLKNEFQTISERNNNISNNEKNNKSKTSKLISELTQEKKRTKKLEEDIKQLRYEINKKDLILRQKEEEIQSINYGKTQMTSIIAQKENEVHNLIIERDSFQKHYQECSNQLKNLKEKIKEKDDKDKNEFKTNFKLKEQYESVIKKYINEINSLKQENENLNEKLKENENIFKEYDLALNDKNRVSQSFEELFDKLEIEMNEQINNKKNWINNDKEIFDKLNTEKENSLKLIQDIQSFII